MTGSRGRVLWLDSLRGIAILLMVLFHLCYDLNYFRFLSIDLHHDLFWLAFRWLIVTLFLFAVGVSLGIVHGRGIRYASLRKRLLTLGSASGAISLATWLAFPQYWVYFGIIHFILVASFLALPFVGRTLLPIFLGALIFALYWSGLVTETGLFGLFKEPLHLPRYTLDLVPLLPWFAVVLIGIAFASAGLHWRMERYLPEHPFPVLRWSGRHALAIYLLHQPLLFGAVDLFYSLTA